MIACSNRGPCPGGKSECRVWCGLSLSAYRRRLCSQRGGDSLFGRWLSRGFGYKALRFHGHFSPLFGRKTLWYQLAKSDSDSTSLGSNPSPPATSQISLRCRHSFLIVTDATNLVTDLCVECSLLQWLA